MDKHIESLASGVMAAINHRECWGNHDYSNHQKLVRKWDVVIESDMGKVISYYSRELLLYSLEVQSVINKGSLPDEQWIEGQNYALPQIRRVFGELSEHQIGTYNPKYCETVAFSGTLPGGNQTYHHQIRVENIHKQTIDYLMNKTIINGLALNCIIRDGVYMCEIYA